MIGLINCGVGNYQSFANTLDYLNIKFKEVKSPEDLNDMGKIILPGVGSFKALMEFLHNKNLIEELNYRVLEQKIPFLGVCVGMQILCTYGYEFEKTKGLNWIEGEVQKVKTIKNSLPNIGWHDLNLKNDSILFKNFQEEELCFYFVHSFAVKARKNDIITSSIDYETEVTATVEYKNIFGTQFHPEKSQQSGIKLIQNFCNL